MQLMAFVICTGSGDICRQTSLKSESFGFITSNLMAEETKGNELDCSLQLTDLPQHTLIEISVNSYSTPYGCFCASEKNNFDYCNYIQIGGVTEVKNYCLDDEEYPKRYLYTNNEKSFTFKPYFQNSTVGLRFNMTYKG